MMINFVSFEWQVKKIRHFTLYYIYNNSSNLKLKLLYLSTTRSFLCNTGKPWGQILFLKWYSDHIWDSFHCPYHLSYPIIPYIIITKSLTYQKYMCVVLYVENWKFLPHYVTELISRVYSLKFIWYFAQVHTSNFNLSRNYFMFYIYMHMCVLVFDTLHWFHIIRIQYCKVRSLTTKPLCPKPCELSSECFLSNDQCTIAQCRQHVLRMLYKSLYIIQCIQKHLNI